ncbi:MAG TPA: UTP--glucose-1-phosphate uridylyltransferase, partial [Isosphaeraceae bacterium]|nr:UTP--glucose-1-phosphate uridylyltransferase [Isosphaeraceae bacterium]
QNVGPILNMVTEKYLLRSGAEWRGRQEALRIFQEIVQAVQTADVKAIGSLTFENWKGPLKGIIPWVSNAFTEEVIRRVSREFGTDFWGFLMLGGMSGGGMGLFVDPRRHTEFRNRVGVILKEVKSSLDDALPFAMEPVVYDFRINPNGTFASLRTGAKATMPARYYTLQMPRLITEGATVDEHRKLDIHHFADDQAHPDELLRVFRTMVHSLFPVTHGSAGSSKAVWDAESDRIKQENGFDPVQHAQLREDYQRGRIDLARNRLPIDTDIRDVADSDLIDASSPTDRALKLGQDALRSGRVAVVTLAAGVGSRWTTGAGVVKAINPFVNLDGRHRSFLEIHLAKTA